jgi:predicted dehydrogenase
MANRRLRLGIMGVGLIGYNWHLKRCKDLKNLFNVTAVCELNREWGEKAAGEFGAEYYSDSKKFFNNSNPEIVIVALPGIFHKPMAIEALKKGKHVLVEKPMAMNLKEVEQMIAAAKKYKRHLFVHHNRRWDSDFVTLGNILKKKMLGAPYVIESKVGKYGRVRGFTKGKNIDWRLTTKFGGGRLNEWGSHLVDQMLLLIDSEPAWVCGDLQNNCWKKDAEDHVNIWIKFKNGILGKIEISQSSRISLRPRWFALGTKATLASNCGVVEPGNVYPKGVGFEISSGDENKVKTKTVSLVKTDINGLYKNIYNVIVKNAKPLIKLDEMRQVIKVIDAVRKSNKTGKVVYF